LCLFTYFFDFPLVKTTTKNFEAVLKRLQIFQVITQEAHQARQALVREVLPTTLPKRSVMATITSRSYLVFSEI
jgi:hypothetical protein